MPNMHPLAERILSGDTVSQCEISEYNAQWLRSFIDKGPHDPEQCFSKDCKHGPTASDFEYAERLQSHEFCCSN